VQPAFCNRSITRRYFATRKAPPHICSPSSPRPNNLSQDARKAPGRRSRMHWRLARNMPGERFLIKRRRISGAAAAVSQAIFFARLSSTSTRDSTNAQAIAAGPGQHQDRTQVNTLHQCHRDNSARHRRAHLVSVGELVGGRFLTTKDCSPISMIGLSSNPDHMCQLHTVNEQAGLRIRAKTFVVIDAAPFFFFFFL